MWWVPLAAAGIGALTARVGNREAKQRADEQMQFQESMSNTAFQRGVKDMSLAGINPMLSAKMGGASTPPGAMASTENEGSAAISSASQAMGIQSGLQQIEQSKALTGQAEAQTMKIRSETVDQTLNSAIKAAQAQKLLSEAGIKDVELWLSRGTKEYAAKQIMAKADSAELEAKGKEQTFHADVRRRKAESRLRELEIPGASAGAKFYSGDLGEASPYVRQLLEVLRGVSGATRR